VRKENAKVYFIGIDVSVYCVYTEAKTDKTSRVENCQFATSSPDVPFNASDGNA